MSGFYEHTSHAEIFLGERSDKTIKMAFIPIQLGEDDWELLQEMLRHLKPVLVTADRSRPCKPEQNEDKQNERE